MTHRSCAPHRLSMLLGLFLLGPTVEAEEPQRLSPPQCEQTLSLEELRAYALKNSPLVAEIDKNFAEQIARAIELKTLPNPELQAERTFTGMKIQGANDPQAQISLGQPLRLSNFGSRRVVADLLRQTGELEKRSALLELLQKLSLQYHTLQTLEQTQSLIQNAEQRATKKVALIREGVKKGLLSEGDEKLFEGEKYRLQAEQKGTLSSIASLKGELARSFGLRCGVNTGTPRTSPNLPSLEVLVEKARTSEFSEIARIDLLTKLTNEQLRLAELDVLPQLTPRLMYQHTNDGGDFFGVGFSVPLPLWNQNQAEQTRAHADVRVAEQRRSTLRDGGFQTRLEQLYFATISAEEQEQLYSTKVIPAFEAALQSQERLYAEGKGNILQVWQTLRTWNETQIQALRLRLQAKIARTELSIAVGEEL